MNNRGRQWEKARHNELKALGYERGLTTVQLKVNNYFNKFPRKTKKLRKKNSDVIKYILNSVYGRKELNKYD